MDQVSTTATRSASQQSAEGQLQVRSIREREATMAYPTGPPLPQIPDAFMSPQPRATSGVALRRRTSSRTPHRPRSQDAALRAAEERATLLTGELQQFQNEHRLWAQNAQRQAETEMQARLQTQMQRFEHVAEEYRAKLVEYRDVGRSEIGQEQGLRQALQEQNAHLAASYRTQFDSGMAIHSERQAHEIATLRAEMMHDVLRQEEAFKAAQATDRAYVERYQAEVSARQADTLSELTLRNKEVAHLNTTVTDLHGMVQQLQSTISHLQRPPSRAEQFQMSDDAEEEEWQEEDEWNAEEIDDNATTQAAKPSPSEKKDAEPRATEKQPFICLLNLLVLRCLGLPQELTLLRLV